MIRLLNESNKSDITARLINQGFYIAGCKVDWVEDNGDYRVLSASKSFEYLALEYSSEEEAIYIDYKPLEDDSEEIEETFQIPSELTKCVLRWNELVRTR